MRNSWRGARGLEDGVLMAMLSEDWRPADDNARDA
jgi:hypothetical protein